MAGCQIKLGGIWWKIRHQVNLLVNNKHMVHMKLISGRRTNIHNCKASALIEARKQSLKEIEDA